MTFPLTGTGIWNTALRYGDLAASAEAAAELEALGFTALWIPDVGGNLFEAVENLLAATTSITVATGILNLWMHTPEVTAERFTTLRQQHGDRLLFGIGVSHAPLVNSTEDGRYQKPLAKTRAYLEAIDATATPVPQDRRVLAALGPKMLELSRSQAGGSHPYLVTAEHTATVRDAVGPDRLVAPEQAVVFETDADVARAIARKHLAMYLSLPNYANNWKRVGFTDEDLQNGGSDRLVDALVAWGPDEEIRARLDAHHEAGADHVCVQVLAEPLSELPMDGWRRLAELTRP